MAISERRVGSSVVLGVTPRAAQALRVEAFDVTGRRVATLLDGVVDATAGLGRDAFLLASLGAQVTLIERSPHVHARLAAGLEAAAADPKTVEVVARMTLLHGDARLILPTLRPDVVVVDPMHPERTSSALVKKDMRLLRDLVGTDPDQLELMQAALACAGRRVVLKWPRKGPPMPGLRAPSHQIIGKTLRYDVFMTAAA